MPPRRDFLATLGVGAATWPFAAELPAVALRGPVVPRAGAAAGAMPFACHTMTWGDDYVTGLADIAAAGFRGVQPRASVLPARPVPPRTPVPCQVVELGRGRVDLPGAFHALSEVGYSGGVILELDAVPDAGGSPAASMLASERSLEQVLKLPL